MHHKRKRSSTRTEIKRMDQKSYRAAESRAIENGTVKGNPRTDRWGYRPEPLPLIDGICNGSTSGSPKVRKPKAKHGPKCRHEWYEETVTENRYYTRCTKPDCPAAFWYSSCEGCWDSVKLKWWKGAKQYYTITKRQATCINCWEVRVYEEIDSRKPPVTHSRWGYRRRLRRKIRTQDPASGMTTAVR